ncbi:100_t:CDS:2 [Diversispora eburnea]|uniref:100_t:CDS:1 n=1 Tax=Diversispora eburnea TaxID=1213867 RepID=A0A9N8YWV2_9GLOM|nr:100_t:CDS:2 [Diversispora eburnea]
MKYNFGYLVVILFFSCFSELFRQHLENSGLELLCNELGIIAVDVGAIDVIILIPWEPKASNILDEELK